MASIAQAQANGVVVGLKSVSEVKPRREIDDLVVNEPDVFNLFLLALESLQKSQGGKEAKMSYFAIAGLSLDFVHLSKESLSNILRHPWISSARMG